MRKIVEVVGGTEKVLCTMTNTETIHVVFAADTRYYQHLCVTLVSILENNRDVCIHAYVLTNRLSGKAEAPLKSLERRYNNLVLHFREINDSQFSGLKLTIDYISVQTYYRYILAQVFPTLDKVLYLDCDIVVRGSLKELWAENLDGYCAAGVFDPYVDSTGRAVLNRIGFQGRNDYVNAGVLLFNLKAIRENNLVNEFFSCQQINQNIIEFQDQDVINMVLKGRIKLLPSQFNWMSWNITNSLSSPCPEPIIVHYTGNVKPWTLDNSCGGLSEEYWKYLFHTPYASYYFYYHVVLWGRKLRDFIFCMKTSDTAFRIKIFGIRVYKKTKFCLPP